MLAEAKDRDNQQALRRYHDEGEETREWRMGFRDFTAEDHNASSSSAAGRPTATWQRCERAPRRFRLCVRWTTEDRAAWAPPRAAARSAVPNPSGSAVAG